ncbi:MAG: hypothetical protein R2735_10695 [Microthrixaceae bacterium]
MIGKSEMAEVDDWFESVPLTCFERPIPKSPVIYAGAGFGQPPRHPVSPDPHSKTSNVSQIGLKSVVMAARLELVNTKGAALVDD